MILPTDDECMRVLLELRGHHELTEWESEFIETNIIRSEFTDGQKQVVANLLKKYDV